MVLQCHRCESSLFWECEIRWCCQWRLISRGSGRLCGNWWLYTHPNTKACWVEVQGGCCISLSVLFDSLFSFKQLEAAFSYIGSLRCRRPMENNSPACVRNTHTHTQSLDSRKDVPWKHTHSLIPFHQIGPGAGTPEGNIQTSVWTDTWFHWLDWPNEDVTDGVKQAWWSVVTQVLFLVLRCTTEVWNEFNVSERARQGWFIWSKIQ